jgi:hypothetical protein
VRRGRGKRPWLEWIGVNTVPAAALVSVLAALAAGGCGAGEDESSGPLVTGPASTVATSGAGLPSPVNEMLAERDGPDVALVMGTSDFAVGQNRLTFLVVENDGELVQAPTARVRATGPRGARAEGEAILVPLGPHTHPEEAEPHDHADATDLYAAGLELEAPGRWWLVVDPAGQEIQGVGAIDVRDETLSPAVGSKAPASDTPTLADAPAEEITTARQPDVELLRHSISDSLAGRVPFVVVFATPAFCQSRTCGPTVEVVDDVRPEFEPTGVRFIHVEIYEGNDPDKGFNRWVREWDLPTEPWVFLVDGAGIIRAKFEGSVSVAELRAAVREHLRTGP